jgi:steroid delta-isomerase-like uncharacterized protein
MDHATSMRRVYDLINAGDINGFASKLADDFAEREDLPGFAPTKTGVLEYFRMLLAAFPDLRMDPQDVIANADKAVARVRVTGTHKGPFMGISATGRRIDVTLIDIIRFGDDGRAHEHWGVIDQLALLQQLGAIPSSAPT